jgi:hypothetical protein
MLVVVVALLVVLGGCAGKVNPSFPTTEAEARRDLERMHADPRPGPRPVVVVTGFIDPGLAAPVLAKELRGCLGPGARVIEAPVGFAGSIDEAGDRLVKRVEEELGAGGAGGAGETPEVDVVAYSMGGLVARAAAVPKAERGALRIGALYSIVVPHRGASMAAVPLPGGCLADMRCGSACIKGLDEAGCGYEVVSYARLGDIVVGEANTAPPGKTPIWVPTPLLEPAHLGAIHDARILADIARRIRGEEPLAREPGAPLPGL